MNGVSLSFNGQKSFCLIDLQSVVLPFLRASNTNNNRAVTAPRHDFNNQALANKIVQSYHENLVADISCVIIAEIQRKKIGNSLVDKFIDELQGYRERRVIYPSHYHDDVNVTYKIATELQNITDPRLIERAFELLSMNSDKRLVIGEQVESRLQRYMAMAQNTSMAISKFGEWSKFHDIHAYTNMPSDDPASDEVKMVARKIATTFIDDHIKFSIKAIDLNYLQAMRSYPKRIKKNQKEIAWKRHGDLELVK